MKEHPISRKEHNEDTPFDSKLLNDDDASSLIVLGNFGEVDWHPIQRVSIAAFEMKNSSI